MSKHRSSSASRPYLIKLRNPRRYSRNQVHTLVICSLHTRTSLRTIAIAYLGIRNLQFAQYLACNPLARIHHFKHSSLQTAVKFANSPSANSRLGRATSMQLPIQEFTICGLHSAYVIYWLRSIMSNVLACELLLPLQTVHLQTPD